MATLKERDNNWAARGIVRRDFRHSKDGPEEIPSKSSKNTKKWCKGRQDVKHVLAKKTEYYWFIYKCIHCGKEFWRIKDSDRQNYDFVLRDWSQ